MYLDVVVCGCMSCCYFLWMGVVRVKWLVCGCFLLLLVLVCVVYVVVGAFCTAFLFLVVLMLWLLFGVFRVWLFCGVVSFLDFSVGTVNL